MAYEFQQSHPTGIMEMGCAWPSLSSLKTPRLWKADTALATCEASEAVLASLHYTSKKQADPPVLPHVTCRPSSEKVTCTHTSLHRAQEKDAQWLNFQFQPTSPTPPMEWSGFSSHLAQKSADIVKNQPLTYLFGPLIDASPARPDTLWFI